MMTQRGFSSTRRSIVAASTASPFLAAMGCKTAAAAAAVPPVIDFFRPPTLSSLRLAPGGKHVAGIRDVNGRANITVMDLETRKATTITNFRDGDVFRLRWINEKRLAFSVRDHERGSGDQYSGGLFVIDRDGTNYRSLAERSWITVGGKFLPEGSSFHSRIFEDGKWSYDIRVSVSSMRALGNFASDVYRVNTDSAQSTLLTLGGPGNVVDWVFDRKNVARAAVSVVKGVTRLFFREDADAPWRALTEVQPDQVINSVTPLAFDKEGNLYVSAYNGQDNAAIYRYDAKGLRMDPEPVLAVKGYDVDGPLIFTDGGAKLIGIGFEADRDRRYWIDPEIATIQAQIDKALPDAVNLLDISDSGESTRVLVGSHSDRDPGRYFLFDTERSQLEQIASQRKWIDPEKMAPTRFYHYAARDGLSIPAQLTLPPNSSGKLPLVVLHYGGPWVRPIEWHWDPVVQFLASRGYAVFMPAPRASRGFGAKLFQSGWKQWGLAMQDDVTDGVRALISDGIVDAKRVCIAGASYGGYLTMMGLVKEPELFKCGVNWVGVTDPSFMFSVTWTDFNRVDSGRFDLPILVGDPVKDAEQFKRTSPVERAAEIKQPVLMAYGGLDDRVPIVNGERMKAALAKHNPNVQWVVYPEEGHGWSKLEDNIDFWTRVERFLAKNL